MKYYKHSETGDVYAYENDQQRLDFGPKELVPMTPEEVERHTVPTLEEVKEQRKAEITQECLQRIDSGFEYDGHTYDSDAISRLNIVGACTSVTAGIPLPEGFTWRDADNNDVPMDAVGVIELGAAAIRHVQAQYAISWDLKAAIERKRSIKGLEDVQWPQ